MGKLSAIDIIYIIFLTGSLAFGFEAMLVGLGGKLMVLFRRSRGKTLGLAVVSGLTIVIPAIATSILLTLEPIFFAALVLVYTLVASGLVSLVGARFVRAPPLPLPPKLPDEEVRKMTRGLVSKRPRAGKKSSRDKSRGK